MAASGPIKSTFNHPRDDFRSDCRCSSTRCTECHRDCVYLALREHHIQTGMPQQIVQEEVSTAEAAPEPVVYLALAAGPSIQLTVILRR
jgi:hypothetical protein